MGAEFGCNCWYLLKSLNGRVGIQYSDDTAVRVYWVVLYRHAIEVIVSPVMLSRREGAFLLVVSYSSILGIIAVPVVSAQREKRESPLRLSNIQLSGLC